jgi:hypothetical protein
MSKHKVERLKLQNELLNIFTSFSTNVYKKDSQYEIIYEDVKENHNWFFDKKTLTLSTFKPCLQDSEISESYIEHKLKGGIIHFSSLESNRFFIKAEIDDRNSFTISLYTNTDKDFFLLLRWENFSLSNIKEAEKLIKIIYSTLTKSEVFWQNDFYLNLEKSDISIPDTLLTFWP